MIINIDTSEALKFNLNGSDLTVLGTMRELLKQNQGYTETSGKFTFKWLSSKLIFKHLQTAAFKTARQLNNIINKLIRVGLLLKKMFFGKPYFCDIKEQAKTAQHVTAQPSHASAVVPRTVKNNVNPAPTAEEVTDYTTRQGYKGFTVAEFMEYNARRNWTGDWKEHAAKWYEKQIKFKQKPLTYKELFELVAAHKINQTDYQLNKTDGLWYKIPKSTPRTPVKSAAVVGGSSAPAAAVPPSPVSSVAPSLQDGSAELTQSEIQSAINELRKNLGILTDDNKKAEAATSATSFKFQSSKPINDNQLKL